MEKLEATSTGRVIKEEVMILTDMLDETVLHLAGQETFDRIKKLTQLSQEREYQLLEQEIASISTAEMEVIARYFAILPLLINISEDVDLAYEVNYQNNIGQDYLGKLSTTINQVAASPEATAILQNANVVPVLTAHPTQVQRKTMLGLTQKIHVLLRRYRDVRMGLLNKNKWMDELRRQIALMMQSDIIREKKLKVKNEITNVTEYYQGSLIPAITNLTAEYQRLAEAKGIELSAPKPITMGMWIGGDRDGNPFVTAETLRLSAETQAEVILTYYLGKISELYDSFALSVGLVDASDGVKTLAELSSDASIYREKELYRKAFHYISQKLTNTKAYLTENLIISPRYERATDFEADLLIIKNSLLENREKIWSRGTWLNYLKQCEFLASIWLQSTCVKILLFKKPVSQNFSNQQTSRTTTVVCPKNPSVPCF